MVDLLVAHDLPMREGVKDALEMELNMMLFPILLKPVRSIVAHFLENERAKPQTDWEPLNVQTSERVSALLIDFVRYVNRLGFLGSDYHTIATRIKHKMAQLCALIVHHKDRPPLINNPPVKNQMIDYFLAWATNVNMEASRQRANRDLSMACLKALAAHYDKLKLQAKHSLVFHAPKQSPSIILGSDSQEIPSSSGIFRWASLRRITQKIYSAPKTHHSTSIVSSTSSSSNTILGLPTVIAASGVIVVGTAKGWVMVFDYASNLKFVLGSEVVGGDAGAVSALSILHDHTFVAVGRNYLYDLAKPNQPLRTVIPTNMRLVQEGRSEGHLLGNRIIHIDFVGLRHTAIVSADETGLAFYHALGQVLGLASTDVIWILGKYPDHGTVSPQNGLVNHPTLGSDPSHRTMSGHHRQVSEFSIDSASMGASSKSRKPTKIFGTLPLPLGPTPHPTDHHGLVALLTSSKLIIVALKPTPRTCWRCMRNASDPNQNGVVGSLSWLPSSTVKEALGTKKNHHQLDPTTSQNHQKTHQQQQQQQLTPTGIGMDPLLAFSWGKTIRFVTVISEPSKGNSSTSSSSTHPDSLEKESFLKGFNRRLEGNFSSLRFVEGKKWCCNSNVLAVQWLSWRIICVLTCTHFEVIDTQIWQRTGFEPIDLRGVVRLNIFNETPLNKSSANPLATPANFFSSIAADSDQSVGGSVAGSFKAYKGKIFLLTTNDLRLGMVVSWAEQILELVEVGSLTEAIDLTTSYWIGRADLETIGLPSDDAIRKLMVKPKLIEIMRASLEYVFSDRRMEDDTHFDLDGRGVDRTELFEGLVRSCATACVAIDELDFIFDKMFEQYQEHGINTIFFLQLQPFILRSEISILPTVVVQGLIALHDNRKQYELIDQIIRRVHPACLDINQALAICSREMLHDALSYIYTEAMDDFVGPIVEFLQFIKVIHSSRQRMQQYCEDANMLNSDLTTENAQKTEDRIKALVPVAYKIFPYLSAILSGLSYPNKTPYEYSKSSKAKSEVYQSLFSGKSIHWPQPDGKLILTTEEGHQEPTYPYLRMLLMLDSEAMLDTLDVAFEDSWLHNYTERMGEKRIDRQLIINLLLEVTSGEAKLSAGDWTFVYIFIARNLHKYSQFLSLPNSTLHSILIGLSSDNNQSTTEDRQLAVEFLLSVYTPPDVEHGTGELVELFKEAGFWRILILVYSHKEMWVQVVHSHLKAPNFDRGIFNHLSATFHKIKLQSSSKPTLGTDHDQSIEAQAIHVVFNAINQLIDIDLPQTTYLIQTFTPQAHLDVVDHIEETRNQFRYLWTLLEPSEEDQDDPFDPEAVVAPTMPTPTNLNPAIRIRYVNLLSKFDPHHVLEYLKSAPLPSDHAADIIKICREEQVHDALIWQLDRAGRTRATFDKLDTILKSQASSIAELVMDGHSQSQSHTQDQERSLDAYVTQVTRCAHTAAEICVEQTRSPQDRLTGEDCWFYLLSTTVQCVQACASLLPHRLPPQAFSTTHSRRAGSIFGSGHN
ncbi:hypothetical protein PCASD_15514 [Puccinia coronata f. sp. avenae]|uniref:Vacuolar protein sorting-associated protein 8 central domain-containing protein n=1 Tax=Puccinia coronata f. sp. avenae TaxID=200324 RepID=A0A2N5UCE2_9BASI|nr:hypothetical protein PCASD_15514 [Puccinia coronata f. sp. avenae]